MFGSCRSCASLPFFKTTVFISRNDEPSKPMYINPKDEVFAKVRAELNIPSYRKRVQIIHEGLELREDDVGDGSFEGYHIYQRQKIEVRYALKAPAEEVAEAILELHPKMDRASLTGHRLKHDREDVNQVETWELNVSTKHRV